jgi:hypothetical protein
MHTYKGCFLPSDLTFTALIKAWNVVAGQVVEIGQVGANADASGVNSFYIHFQREASFGDASKLTEALLRAGDDQVNMMSALTYFWDKIAL